MKTYILRDPKAVEPQNARARRPDPALTALVDAICGPAAPPPSPSPPSAPAGL